MQRSASQMNFIRAIVFSLRRGSFDLANRRSSVSCIIVTLS
jgi:hypothetical protein